MVKPRLLIVLIVLMALALTVGRCARRDKAGEWVTVTRGEIQVTTQLDATLEARSVENIMSHFQGRATLTYVAPEGSAVKKGDVVVRFDDSGISAELARGRQALARASAELDALVHGEIPLELEDSNVLLAEAEHEVEMEKKILKDTEILVGKKLISDFELEQEQGRLNKAEAKLAQARQRRTLLEEHLHPARLAKAESELAAARALVLQLEAQAESCTVPAPKDGIVVALPQHLGSEFRAARVGDAIYPNQPFLCIPDMTSFVAICRVPEADLGRVTEGAAASITPLAYPDLQLKAVVESVGTMAQPLPGLPSWQKFLRVVFRVDSQDARLRPGLTLRVDVASFHDANALLIPRAAIQWVDGAPHVLKRAFTGTERAPIKIGMGSEQHFVVLEGLDEGQRVRIP